MNRRLRISDFIMGLAHVTSMIPHRFFYLVINPLIKRGEYGELVQGLVPYPPEPQTIRARAALQMFHMIGSSCRGLVTALMHIAGRMTEVEAKK